MSTVPHWKWSPQAHFPIRKSLQLRALPPRSEWNLWSDRKSTESRVVSFLRLGHCEGKSCVSSFTLRILWVQGYVSLQTGASWGRAVSPPQQTGHPHPGVSIFCRTAHLKGPSSPSVCSFCWWVLNGPVHVLLMSIFNVSIWMCWGEKKGREKKKRKEKENREWKAKSWLSSFQQAALSLEGKV